MSGQRDSIIRSVCDYAISMIGTKYHHQGRNEFGVDCIGLIMCAYESVGVNIKIPNDYVRNQDGALILQELNKYTVKIDKLELGCILVINIGREPKHMALYLGDNKMIHSYEGANQVTSHDMTIAWHNRIHSIYRVKDNVISVA